MDTSCVRILLLCARQAHNTKTKVVGVVIENINCFLLYKRVTTSIATP